MIHQVIVDPVDYAGIDISHLEQRWNLGASGTAIHPDHARYPPGPFRVSDDHGHAPFAGTPFDFVVAQSAERAFFTAKPASIAVPAANATSPPSPTNWF